MHTTSLKKQYAYCSMYSSRIMISVNGLLSIDVPALIVVIIYTL